MNKTFSNIRMVLGAHATKFTLRAVLACACLSLSTAGAQADISWAAGAPGGSSGGSLIFDGGMGNGAGDEFLETGIGGAGFLDGDYTVSMWLNADDVSRHQYAVGTQNRSLHLGLQGSNPFQGHWGSDQAGSTNAAVVNNSWFHTTFTYDSASDEATIFVNGVETDTTTINAPNQLQDVIIGARRNNGSAREQWIGQVDDVAFFTSVVSDADILALGTSATDALALGANAYYDFEDDQAGTTAAVQVAAGATAIGADLSAITAVAVPEPSSLALLACISAVGLVRRKRS